MSSKMDVKSINEIRKLGIDALAEALGQWIWLDSCRASILAVATILSRGKMAGPEPGGDRG